MNFIGLVAAVAILTAYAISVVWSNPRIFHWANAVLWVPVAIPSLVASVYGATLLTVSFGGIGTYALWTDR